MSGVNVRELNKKDRKKVKAKTDKIRSRDRHFKEETTADILPDSTIPPEEKTMTFVNESDLDLPNLAPDKDNLKWLASECISSVISALSR